MRASRRGRARHVPATHLRKRPRPRTHIPDKTTNPQCRRSVRQPSRVKRFVHGATRCHAATTSTATALHNKTSLKGLVGAVFVRACRRGRAFLPARPRIRRQHTTVNSKLVPGLVQVAAAVTAREGLVARRATPRATRRPLGRCHDPSAHRAAAGRALPRPRSRVQRGATARAPRLDAGAAVHLAAARVANGRRCQARALVPFLTANCRRHNDTVSISTRAGSNNSRRSRAARPRPPRDSTTIAAPPGDGGSRYLGNHASGRGFHRGGLFLEAEPARRGGDSPGTLRGGGRSGGARVIVCRRARAFLCNDRRRPQGGRWQRRGRRRLPHHLWPRHGGRNHAKLARGLPALTRWVRRHNNGRRRRTRQPATDRRHWHRRRPRHARRARQQAGGGRVGRTRGRARRPRRRGLRRQQQMRPPRAERRPCGRRRWRRRFLGLPLRRRRCPLGHCRRWNCSSRPNHHGCARTAAAAASHTTQHARGAATGCGRRHGGGRSGIHPLPAAGGPRVRWRASRAGTTARRRGGCRAAAGRRACGRPRHHQSRSLRHRGDGARASQAPVHHDHGRREQGPHATPCRGQIGARIRECISRDYWGMHT